MSYPRGAGSVSSRIAVTQSESAVNAAKFAMESYAANAENAKVQFERIAALVKTGVGDMREYDNRNAAYMMALAQWNGARSAVNQATAELEKSKADVAWASRSWRIGRRQPQGAPG